MLNYCLVALLNKKQKMETITYSLLDASFTDRYMQQELLAGISPALSIFCSKHGNDTLEIDAAYVPIPDAVDAKNNHAQYLIVSRILCLIILPELLQSRKKEHKFNLFIQSTLFSREISA